MCPTNVSTRSRSLFVVWPAHIISAAKINIGTERRTVDETPAISCWHVIAMSILSM